MKTRKAMLHAVILLLATIITFFWVTNDKLAYYSLQLSGVLLLVLVISHRVFKPISFRLVESTISIIAILLITTATGGLSSPLFFLNFFLLFELSFLLEPIIPFVLSLGFMLFYFYTHQVGSSPLSLLVLLSFPLMIPIAYFFGKIYQKEENQKKEIKHLVTKIENLKEELVEEKLNHQNNRLVVK